MNELNIQTENRNPKSENLDMMSTYEIISLMNKEDQNVINAVHQALPSIAKVIDQVVQVIQNGGRIFYVGAGTSGRLGVLDASECPPTFGVDEDLFTGIIAGGDYALRHAIENAEDDALLGKEDLIAHHVTDKDIVIGIAASGRTPYVIGALQYVDQIGALSASICCNRKSVISSYAKYPIEVDTGPEILTGSTRLKAGTATKMVLNMISSAAMVKTGETYGNLMVDVKQTNDKLHLRAIRIVKTATGVVETTAKETLAKADGDCKTAIVMLLGSCTKEEAIKCIEQNNGMIRKAIQEEKDI